MSETGYVYTLDDPRTDEPRYVGATTDPHSRFSVLVSSPHNDELEAWIRELDKEGLTPDMSLVRVTSVDELGDEEDEVLQDMLGNFELLNADLNASYSHTSVSTKSNGPHRPHIPDTVYEEAKRVKEEQDCASIGEAIRWMCQKGGFDV